jgi:hypothetical protein
MNILTQKPTDYALYLAFTPDTSLDAALKRFVQRFGHQPANWFSYNGQIWVGPVPEPPQESEEQ